MQIALFQPDIPQNAGALIRQTRIVISTRYRLVVAFAVACGMFHTADNSRFTFYNGNWGVQGGAGMSLK